MIVTHKINTIELTRRGVDPVVSVVQDDKYSRNLEIPLTSNGVAWEPPSDATVIVRYRKSDGTGGNYDTLPDGTIAGSIAGNVVTVALAPQVCTAPGVVVLAVSLISGSSEISIFIITIDVQRRPDFNATSEDYINIEYMLQRTPLFANSIAECTDTSKLYVLPDGYIYAYMRFVDGWTNQLPISTDTDGSVFNGTGYKAPARGNSSGECVDLTVTGELDPTIFFTGFIPVQAGDVIRWENCYMDCDSSVDYKTAAGSDIWGMRSGVYDLTKSKLAVVSWGDLCSGYNTVFSGYELDESGRVNAVTVAQSGASYVRLCLRGDPTTAIITVNEEITGAEGSEGYAWMNTGHAFVPADYEDRIIALEEAMKGDLPVYGIVDSENNILMSGTLASGTYTVKYLAEDGTTTDIGTFTME